MSAKRLTIGLAELKTVRIRCESCRVVTEIASGDIMTTFSGGRCLSCKLPFVADAPHDPAANPFYNLSEAFRKFDAVKARVSVEFAIPETV